MTPYYDSDVDAVAEESTSLDILKYGTKDSLDSRIYDFEANFSFNDGRGEDDLALGLSVRDTRMQDVLKAPTPVKATKDTATTKVTAAKDSSSSKPTPTTTKDTKNSRDTTPTPRNRSRVPKHPLEGYWAGHLWTEDSNEAHSTRGLFQILIKSIDEKGKVTGVAENYLETMTVSGRVSPDNTSVKLVFRDDSDGFVMVLKGTLDLKRETLAGTHRLAGYDVDVVKLENESNSQDDGGLDPLAELENLAMLSSPVLEQEPMTLDGNDTVVIVQRTFFFNRTPASAWKFRAHPSQVNQLQTARERWKFACRSVRDMVRQRRCSWSYLKERFAERKKFLDFRLRQSIDELNYTPRMTLSETERLEYGNLVQNIHPADGRFYSSLVVPSLDLRYEHHP